MPMRISSSISVILISLPPELHNKKRMEKSERSLTYPDAQLRAQSELQASETLVWSGVPNPRRAAIASISETMISGIFWVGFAFLWMIQAYGDAASASMASSHTSSPVRGTLIVAFVFLLLGLLELAGRPLWIYRRALRTVYAVTSHRIMIIRGGGSSSVDSLDPAEIYDLKCRQRKNGSGDVMITTNFSYRAKNILAKRRWWFYGVPSAKEVTHLISELEHRRSQTLSRAGQFVALDFNSPG